MGIISACAEQTDGGFRHLRRRPGSSPRVRSRPHGFVDVHAVPGIISACAEQTPAKPVSVGRMGDHLRVCGADVVHHFPEKQLKGSSPRVRSRLLAAVIEADQNGIISACAEQTDRTPTANRRRRDHLRVCGADFSYLMLHSLERGSSPRVRSRLRHDPLGDFRGRIISACAEQTPGLPGRSTAGWDHLRVCGADSCILLWFGLVGCRGIFDSCTARGRKTTWMPIFGIDALGSRMFLCEISEPSPCAEFWLRLHCVHVR